jgi:S1-C subfamily serine protease
MPRKNWGRHGVAAAAAAALLTLATWAAEALDIKRYEQSVVRVIVVVDRAGKTVAVGHGSGFVIAAEYIATNNHVVTSGNETDKSRANATQITVREAGTAQDRKATVLWSSKEFDLAVLHVPGLKGPALKLTSRSPIDYPRKGAEVWALGFPGIADIILPAEIERASATVTRGVVGRMGMGGRDSGRERPVIQHDASINRGSSGGPLLDDCGVVVGVNSFLPMSVFDIGLDPSGRFKAYGTANTGVFASPHIVSLIEAARTTPELKVIRLATTSAACGGDATPIGLYVAVAAALLLAAAALALVLHRGAIRQLMRAVEAYGAWRRRRARAEGAATRRQPSAEGAPPSEASGCALTGTGPGGKAISLEVSADKLAEARNGRERGMVLGRSKRLADLVVPEAGVSRRHVRLVLTPDGSLAIEDLDSARGTRVNDKPVPPYERVPIREGDRIALNGVVLTVKREPRP